MMIEDGWYVDYAENAKPEMVTLMLMVNQVITLA
jgi:hypothetical protein